MTYYKKDNFDSYGGAQKWDDDKNYEDDKKDKKCNCEKHKKHEEKCSKDKEKENYKDDHKYEQNDDNKNEHKVDRNDWIRDLLGCLIERRVVFFTKDGTHTEGTVKEFSKEFVTIIPTLTPFSTFEEPVEVESNANGNGLELFLKYFIRLDDIVGFGEETLGDPPFTCAE